MPSIYLSPSTQEYNPYYGGGNEEYYMNLVADAMEPGRHGAHADRLRELVGEVSLEELFVTCFSQGLVYVIDTGRYLYPTAIDIYNHYVLKQQKGNA